MDKRLVNAILCFGLASISFGSFGASLSDAESYRSFLRSTTAYRETFGRCSKANRRDGFKSKVRIIWESFSFKTFRNGAEQALQVVSLDPVAIGQVINNHGLSEDLVDMLHSNEFKLALSDCYGNNQNLKRVYVSGLIASDVSGKIAVGAVTVAAGWASVKIINAVGKAYPLLKTGALVAGSAFAVKNSYSVIRDFLRDATPEEKLQAEKILATPERQSDAIRSQTELLLKKKMISLHADMNKVSGPERLRIANRILELRDHLDQLES